MENIPHEVSVSLEAFMSLLSSSSKSATADCDDASYSAYSRHGHNSDAMIVPTLTMSSSSSCSNTGGHGNSSCFEIRRAARRLDRALQTLESALEQHQEQDQQDAVYDEGGDGEQHGGSSVSIGPLIQADLVTVLTSLGQAMDETQVDLRSHQDVVHLYQDLALTAVRILTAHDSFPLHRDEQLDSLVDRIALLLLRQNDQIGGVSFARLLNALITCANRHLIHIDGCSSGGNEQVQQHRYSVLFPLLHAVETIQLLKIVLARCSQDMSRRWEPPSREAQQDGGDARLNLWWFCTFLLKHLAGSRGEDPVHGWLQHRFLEDDDQHEHHLRYNDSTMSATGRPRHTLAKDVDKFLNACKTFGVELIEITLEILDQTSIAMETSPAVAVAEYAQDAIRHASLVITTAHILERGLEVALPFAMLRSIFAAYASFVAIFSQKVVQQEGEQEGDISKSMACEILVDLAMFVLQHPSMCSRALGVCDSAMETAVSITLLSCLDSGGVINEKMAPILEYICDQGQRCCSKSTPPPSSLSSLAEPSSRPSMAKRQRRDAADAERNGNKGKPYSVDKDASSYSPNGPFANILEASIMALLMLPNSRCSLSSSDDASVVVKHTAAKLVESYPLNSLMALGTPADGSTHDGNPWHSLVARKVRECFEIDPVRADPIGTTSTNSSWSDQILRKYVVDHHHKQQQQHDRQTAEQTERNVALGTSNGNNS